MGGIVLEEFSIAVTVETVDGENLLEVDVRAYDVEQAKRLALAHIYRIGYERARLGLPSTGKPKRRRR